jgi:hypothetical protein
MLSERKLAGKKHRENGDAAESIERIDAISQRWGDGGFGFQASALRYAPFSKSSWRRRGTFILQGDTFSRTAIFAARPAARTWN